MVNLLMSLEKTVQRDDACFVYLLLDSASCTGRVQ